MIARAVHSCCGAAVTPGRLPLRKPKNRVERSIDVGFSSSCRKPRFCSVAETLA